RRLVEKRFPNVFFVVALYAGYASKPCTETFERNVAGWPARALATPVRGTSLESQLYRSDCDVEPRASLPYKPGMTDAQKTEVGDFMERMDWGVEGDALLFLGKAETLTRTPMEPSIYLDLAYRREIERRAQIAFGDAAGSGVQDNTVSPRYRRDR